MTAGYPGTPLPRKLGMTEGRHVAIVDAPEGWFKVALVSLPGVVVRDLRAWILDVILVFCADRAAPRRRFPVSMRDLAAAGGLWVAWPKRASWVQTDLTESVVREHALAAGLVDKKVAAIDETWSGLRLVVRGADRRRWPLPPP